MLYGKNGNQITDAYSISGTQVFSAYNKDGEIVFTKGTSLKVATYNVGQWYLGNHDNVPAAKDAEYYALQNGMIASIDADILLLEEYTKQFSKLPRTAKSMLEQYYPYIHEQGGDNPQVAGGYGRCVCSKYPITDYVTHIYEYPGSNWYYDSCVVTAFGIQFNVIVTHLHWTNNSADTTRDKEIAELIPFMNAKTNVILGGDFNSGLRTDLTQEEWDNRYNRFVKPFLDAGYNSANYDNFGNLVTCCDGTALDGRSPRYCLDDIYTSSNIQITNAYVDTTKATDSIVEKIDHMPLIAELSIGAI